MSSFKDNLKNMAAEKKTFLRKLNETLKRRCKR